MLGRLLRNVFGGAGSRGERDAARTAATAAPPPDSQPSSSDPAAAAAAYDAITRSDFAGALLRYEALVRDNEQDLESLTNLGLCHAALQQYPQARQRLQ